MLWCFTGYSLSTPVCSGVSLAIVWTLPCALVFHWHLLWKIKFCFTDVTFIQESCMKIDILLHGYNIYTRKLSENLYFASLMYPLHKKAVWNWYFASRILHLYKKAICKLIFCFPDITFIPEGCHEIDSLLHGYNTYTIKLSAI